MKVSELIKLLEELKEKYGDLEVEYYDDVFAWCKINYVEYTNYVSREIEPFIGLS